MEERSKEFEGGEGEAAALPEDVERFISASLWERLRAEPRRRGLLLNALDQLRSVQYLLSTHLPRHIVEQKMRRPVCGLVQGQAVRGSLFFSDVSGFTKLSEALAAEGQGGTEQLTDTLNRYFDEMINILAWSGGVLVRFAGDALLVYFPERAEMEQTRWAIRTGERMLRAIADFPAIPTQSGVVKLKMKVGISTGEFLGASVGNAERMEYFLLGETVSRMMGAEDRAASDQVVIDAATAECVRGDYCLEPCHEQDESQPGFFVVCRDTGQALDDFEIAADKRRARSSLTLTASTQATIVQMEVLMRQIKALIPYLAPELVERIVARAGQRRVESEFRPTTILFLSFTGLESLVTTALGNGLGAAGIRQPTHVLNEYFTAVHDVITRHGGVVSHTSPYGHGANMLVLFGAPRAQEDDAQRAVNAALQMKAELSRLNERWRQSSKGPGDRGRGGAGGAAGGERPQIQQRIGITQGVVFFGQLGSPKRREYTVIGDDVNLASRLMSAASPGQILISQQIYHNVSSRFSAVALPAIRVKGKSSPIAIYEPVGLYDDLLVRRLKNRDDLIGRDAERRQGQRLIGQAMSGQGTVLVVTGQTGIGKSHLADDLAAEALAQGVRLVFSECTSYTAQAPYTPWVTALRSLLGIVCTDPPDVQHQALLKALSAFDLPDRHAELLSLFLRLPSATRASGPRERASGPRERASGLRERETGPREGMTGERFDWAPSSPQQAPASKSTSTLFARLGERVAAPREEKTDLWQMVAARQDAQPGQMWHDLQTVVTNRRREQLFRAVSTVLGCLTSNAPSFMLIENGQWMDPASHELLDYLQHEIDRLPLLILVLQRDKREGRPSDTEKAASVLTLEPFALPEVNALVADLLEGVNVEPRVVEAIYQQSGGNPFFVKEMAGWMKRTGQMTLEALTEGLHGPRERADGPVLLQKLVLGRFDSMMTEERDTLRVAAVVGNSFSQEMLAALLPELDAGSLDLALCSLEQARLIVPVSEGKEASFAFRQPLVREVIYGSQSAAWRRKVHAEVALQMERCDDDDLVRDAEMLSHHQSAAGEPLLAARYLLVSALKAQRRYAYSQAAAYYDQVLDAAAQCTAAQAAAGTDQGLPVLQAGAQEGHGDIALLKGETARAGQWYEGACTTLGDEIAARVWVKQAMASAAEDELVRAERLARRACSSDDVDRSGAMSTLAWILWRAGEDEADEWIESTRASIAEASGKCIALIGAFMAELAEEWRTARQGYQSLDYTTGAVLVALREGDQRLREGNLLAALSLYKDASACAEREDDPYVTALACYRQAEAGWRSGDQAAANALLQKAVGLLQRCRCAVDQEHAMVQSVCDALADGDGLANGKGSDWPRWSWTHLEDLFHISLLLEAFPTLFPSEQSYIRRAAR